jgi:hypothetical protein
VATIYRYQGGGLWRPITGAPAREFTGTVEPPPDEEPPPPVTDVTHGEQLTDAHLGPWSLQNVARGSETLQTVAIPERGYWRHDTPDEFAPTGTYVYNNDPANHGGVVPAGGLTIDGYAFPAGTRVTQFRDVSATDFLVQGTGGSWLFRGCRFRNDSVGGSSTFNDNNATYSQFVHFSDFGGTHPDTPLGGFWKSIGGSGHRFYRNMVSDTWTGLQPNVPNFHVIENIITDVHFPYGELGPNGNADSATNHVNGLSVEGGARGLVIQRNKILLPSPDRVPAAIGGTGPGQPGYGTQPGQVGYGDGSNPGRVVPQTDCIAIFAITGSNDGVTIEDNLLGGTGYCLYAGNADGQAANIVVRGNQITTEWWTDGGNFGPITDVPAWGTNGNIAEGNTWADDYGSGGDGSTALVDRQYPTGDGPRAGTVVFGDPDQPDEPEPPLEEPNMAGLTNTESAATLDARFTTGDFVAYSTNGTSEFAGLARTAIGTWAAATTADPSVKANGAALTSAAATGAGTVTHFAIYSASTAGTQRTDWTALSSPRTLAIGDTLTWAVGSLTISLT